MSAQLWTVVGGKTTNGILVRDGQSLKSKELSKRLGNAAIVEELELKEDVSRLRYKLLKGDGPSEGWISLKLKNDTLVKRIDRMPEANQERDCEPVALMFPGQGSQYVGMLDGVKEIQAVKDMLEKARSILDYDLLELCLNGPEEKLAQTRYCQPAMFVAALAGVEKLRTDRPRAAEKPRAVAGLSLGEYTALCAAGVLQFDDALKLVKLRGEAMQDAAAEGEQLMLSVAGLDKEKLSAFCKQARDKAGGQATCQIANELFPKGYACGGSGEAIRTLEKLVLDGGALQAKVLKTSGAFHTPLMSSAQDRLNAALDEVLPKMSPPSCDIVMNVTGDIIPAGTEPSTIIENLKKQLTQAVLWEKSIQLMIKEGIVEFYEIGPMKQLKAMMKRTNPEVWKTTVNVDV